MGKRSGAGRARRTIAPAETLGKVAHLFGLEFVE
jgi:hypothetical protein